MRLGIFALSRTYNCDIDKPFKWNVNKFRVIAGHEYLDVNNDIVFPHDVDFVDNSVDTCFMGFAHNGIIYAPSNENMKYGVRRLTGERLQDKVGDDLPQYDLEEYLSVSQERFLKSEFVLANVRDYVGEFRSYREVNNISSPEEEDYWERNCDYVERPHNKKKERIEANREIETNGWIAKKSWLRQLPHYKPKKNEVAKARKYMRMIMDLGTSASLEGAEWLEHCKGFDASMHRTLLGRKKYKYHTANFRLPIDVIRLIYEFVGDEGTRLTNFRFVAKMDTRIIQACLTRAWFAQEEDFFYVHSDDSVISFWSAIERRRIVVNADIISADTSHGPGMFDLLYSTLDNPALVDRLERQIYANVKIESTRKERVILKVLQPYLQSGSVITTKMNTMAWWVIWLKSVLVGGITSVQHLREIAKSVGYLIEIEECRKIEDMQFLKHSLYSSRVHRNIECAKELGGRRDVDSMSDDYITWWYGYKAALNAGVWMRAAGRCFGPIPGRGNIFKRAAQFQTLLMYGMLHSVNIKGLTDQPGNGLFPDKELYEGLFCKRGVDRSKMYAQLVKYWPKMSYIVDEPTFVFRVPTWAVLNDFADDARDYFARYNLSDSELEELLDYIKNMGVCDHVYCAAVDKILLKDYGLRCPLNK
jgi:uncharacterized protein YeeX (DUF496 family)